VEGGDEPVIRLEDVWVRYFRVTALKGVSLSLEKGLHVVVGPNSSGKTTLLKVIAGILRPWRGKVSVYGKDPVKEGIRSGGLVGGSVGDEAAPYWMKGFEFISMAMELSSCSKACRARIAEAARLLGVDRFWGMRIAFMSTGMAKKLVILVALANESEVLVVDEPFSGLDEESVYLMARLLESEASRRTVIVATHIAPSNLSPQGLHVMVDGTIKYSVTTGKLSSIKQPIIRARLSEKVLDALGDVIGAFDATRVEWSGRALWAVMNGAQYERCLKEGLCEDEPSIDVKAAMELVFQGDGTA